MLQKNTIFNLSTDKNTGFKYRKCDASLKFQIPMNSNMHVSVKKY